ncbi:uncharacterized protein LOC108893157 isoform X2 [Lates calcarifer]|uniref:Uncharacterized protein LOC108893157 isoform X2 n=1 Tax=Lates calcarifer TaxID=8187 RepID=A0AAJ7VCH0_LATCA|nr:uncharacterized protein LOC108893157 isoform X2 [Lates calcarifer]
MGRNKWRVSHDGGLNNKRDTPVKAMRSRRCKHRKPLPSKQYEALPEEPEVEMTVGTVKPTSPAWAYPLHGQTSFKPVHHKSVLHLNNPACTGNSRLKAVSPAAPTVKQYGFRTSPTWHPTVQMSPDPEAFKSGEVLVKEKRLKLAVTPEGITFSSMETNTTFDFNHDDEEDCYSASSSSSLPSPEIFRKENYAETLTSSVKEELLGLHLHIKNSTLLDASHAETIHMHHSPNLSTIIGASTILAERTCEISNHGGPEAETKIQTDSFKSDPQTVDNQAQAFKFKTPAKLTNKRPILCKKKVSFKTPIAAETFEAKHSPATKLTIRDASESVQTSSSAEQMTSVAVTSRAGEINSEDDTPCVRVMLKRPVKSSPEKAKFFDFLCDNERDVFFQRMRERCVKLRSMPLFPLTAAQHVEASVL